MCTCFNKNYRGIYDFVGFQYMYLMFLVKFYAVDFNDKMCTDI